ncbi:hypothetical protein [Shewanella pealeana]|uniref:Uncharacterized protein n=1 Tax=Shewanella pealeana (strain ATCC 700345 / ANG-SQ1) TaxID=398579 RepID=A8H4V6_SHEPA|nr:hypothetical protein [Shewanella pealeana]ABV87593.1 hypothetical protein Spea_2273 [Shewanella pealeana ATCC 700345]
MFEPDSNQTIHFVFEFKSELALRGGFRKLHERVEHAEFEVRILDGGKRYLRITRELPLNEAIIEQSKIDIAADLKHFGGKFVSAKVRKIASGGTLKNKPISVSSRLLHLITSAGDSRTFRKYKMPYFFMLIVVFLLIVIQVVTSEI